METVVNLPSYKSLARTARRQSTIDRPHTRKGTATQQEFSFIVRGNNLLLHYSDDNNGYLIFGTDENLDVFDLDVKKRQAIVRPFKIIPSHSQPNVISSQELEAKLEIQIEKLQNVGAAITCVVACI